MSRNTHLLINTVPNQVAGPRTNMLLYESAVGMMNVAVSGSSMGIGPRSAGGKLTDSLTPLECGFCGRGLKSCAGMERCQANQNSDKPVPRYEDMLMDPPEGKSVTECYDIHTLKPTKECVDVCRRVTDELVELGMLLPAV